ncbi:hypothetical protein LMH87_001424 [Akanthomyces muscarius]|uniref:Rhodopsin domain-containing protein n=1 Tax=Akanthomyces muscarius TaxID=2231603 RepID=A0A9W8Q499_AKAMU|nr:hypothetical protein LMH87_001424 [Akanthomyces muscarius]KAJ4146865.1 hypothetical protein LMH87_001424 [Akanthomyces muscarius]
MGVPDLDDAKHIHRAELTAIVWVCFGTASVFVASRIFLRTYNYGRIKLDDVWMILAWASMLVMCILEMLQQKSLWYTAATTEGQVDPDSEMRNSQLLELAKWQFASINLFWVCLWCVKASLLSFCNQLVSPFKTRRIMWILFTIIVILAFVACGVSNIVSCHTPSDYPHSGRCTTGLDLYRQRFNILFSTALDIATDILIVTLPLSVLPLMNLDKRKKIALGFMFTLSLLIVCVSIVRMTQILVDVNVDLVGLTVWSTVETCIALIMGSVSPFSGLLSRRVGNIKTIKPIRTIMDNDFNPEKLYPLGSRTVTTTKIEPVPVGDLYYKTQHSDGIYVQRTFESYAEDWVETDGHAASSDDGSGFAMVRMESDKAHLTRR